MIYLKSPEIYLGKDENNKLTLSSTNIRKEFKKNLVNTKILLTKNDLNYYYSAAKRLCYLYIKSNNIIKDDPILYKKLIDFISEKNNDANFNKFYEDFNQKLEIIALSRNVGDKFSYHTSLSYSELFNIVGTSVLYFASIAISIAIPPFAPIAPTIMAGVIINSSLTATNILCPLLQKGYLIFREDEYNLNNNIPKILTNFETPKSLIDAINPEFIEDFRESLLYKNKLSRVNKRFENLNNLSASFALMSDSVRKNGLLNFNLTELFVYYVELTDKFNEFQNNKYHFEKNYHKNQENIEKNYYKLMNYYRYVNILKSTPIIQTNAIKIGLLKSIKILFENDSSFSIFCKNNINNNKNSFDIIKKIISKNYKIGCDKTLNDFSDIIYSSMSKINEKDIKKVLKDISEMKDLSTSVKNIFMNLTFPTNILNPIKIGVGQFVPDSAFNSAEADAGIMSGGIIFFNLIFSVLYLANDRKPSKKFEKIQKIMQITSSASKVGRVLLGSANYIGNWFNLFQIKEISNFANCPFEFLAHIGIEKIRSTVEKKEKQMWDNLIEQYRKNIDNIDKKDVDNRSMYSFYKKNGHRSTTYYMKNIAETHSKLLTDITNSVHELNGEVINILKMTENYNLYGIVGPNFKNGSKPYYIKAPQFDPKKDDSVYRLKHNFPKINLYSLNSEERIIEAYISLFVKANQLASKIEKYEFYMNNYVNGFLIEVDYSLQLYMAQLKLKDVGSLSMTSFCEKDNNYQNVINTPSVRITSL